MQMPLEKSQVLCRWSRGTAEERSLDQSSLAKNLADLQLKRDVSSATRRLTWQWVVRRRRLTTTRWRKTENSPKSILEAPKLKCNSTQMSHVTIINTDTWGKIGTPGLDKSSASLSAATPPRLKYWVVSKCNSAAKGSLPRLLLRG